MTSKTLLKTFQYKQQAERLQRALDDVYSRIKSGKMYAEMMDAVYDMKLIARIRVALRVIRGR